MSGIRQGENGTVVSHAGERVAQRRAQRSDRRRQHCGQDQKVSNKPAIMVNTTGIPDTPVIMAAEDHEIKRKEHKYEDLCG